jgi:hypothetical protein
MIELEWNLHMRSLAIMIVFAITVTCRGDLSPIARLPLTTTLPARIGYVLAETNHSPTAPDSRSEVLRMKRAVRFSMIGLALILSLGLWLALPPVGLRKLKRIASGATKAQLLGALGEPTARYNGDRDCVYSGVFTSVVVRVSFDEKGLYRGYVYDP